MKRVLVELRNFLKHRFTLTDGMQEEHVVVQTIRKDVVFRGTNVWTLVFAIFIASIGLNVNSTAVVIGAMLISPLMGPIIGIGLGIGINDIELLKKGVLNICIAAGVSIATSSLYFTITPLHDASSELLARTTPTTWDVFIAFFGGLAGIVAATRREKTNVIPGVAIATALMPPLCTAGFGLATGQWYYFLGAIYLFFINCLFICLATLIVVKRLKFHRVEFTTPEREKRISRVIFVIVILTVIPSIYLAYRLVQRSIFENNVSKFVQEEFNSRPTQVAKYEFNYDKNIRQVELLLVGQTLTAADIDTLSRKLQKYNLVKTKLVVHQGVDAEQMMEQSSFNSKTLEELNTRINALANVRKNESNPNIKKELEALFPDIQSYSFTRDVIIYSDTTGIDTVSLFTGKFAKELQAEEKDKLNKWLKQRTRSDSVKILFE